MYNIYMSETLKPESSNSQWEVLQNYEQPRHIDIIDMIKSPEGKLAAEFPSNVYLFHSANESNMKEILRSGAIMNAGAIYDQKLAEMRAQLEAEGKSEEEITKALNGVSIARNSGQEGISWSSNGIDALPGDEGHIAGFVAAPEMVLGDNKLVVPSRPAPYELLQVSDGVNAKEFFEAKKQFEVWGYKEAPITEKASVDNGLMYLRLDNLESEKPENERNQFIKSSLVHEFAKKGGLPAEELRKHFEITEDGHVKLDEQLHQQTFDENYIPPVAVFVQAMLDKGLFQKDKFNGTVLEGLDLDGMGVNEIIEKTHDENNLTLYMLYHARNEAERYMKKYDDELDKAKSVGANVESMYLVTNKKDLDKWMNEIEESGHYPKGILLYDDEKVVKPNFASAEKGDNAELANEIGRVVGADGDFWRREMAMDVDNIPRAGSQG